jgi:hypothetical protein
MVELMLFDEVAEAMRAMVPDELGTFRHRARRYGIKVWFGPADPPREHYEAQVVAPAHVDGATILALEIGFHAEHPDVATNDATIARIVSADRSWRKILGDDAEVAPFLGRPKDWRRVSETWSDPDLSDPELGFEIASRLTDYLIALEPIRKRT